MCAYNTWKHTPEHRSLSKRSADKLLRKQPKEKNKTFSKQVLPFYNMHTCLTSILFFSKMVLSPRHTPCCEKRRAPGEWAGDVKVGSGLFHSCLCRNPQASSHVSPCISLQTETHKMFSFIENSPQPTRPYSQNGQPQSRQGP